MFGSKFATSTVLGCVSASAAHLCSSPIVLTCARPAHVVLVLQVRVSPVRITMSRLSINRPISGGLKRPDSARKRSLSGIRWDELNLEENERIKASLITVGGARHFGVLTAHEGGTHHSSVFFPCHISV